MALKILLADDSMTAQNMGKKILTEAGYEVIAVSNGAQAVKKIAAEKPDLAVLDVFMPGYTGVEVCERIKKAQETAHMPVLLTVGKMEPFKPEEGTRAGAEGLVVKPFEASDLIAAIKKIEEKLAGAAVPAETAEYDATVRMPPAVEEFQDASYEEWKVSAPETPSEEAAPPALSVPHEMASAPAFGMESFEEPAAPPPDADTQPIVPPPLARTTEAMAPPAAERTTEAITPPVAVQAPARTTAEMPAALQAAAGAAVAPAVHHEIEFTSHRVDHPVDHAPAPGFEPTVSQEEIVAPPGRDPGLVTDTDELSHFATKFGVEGAEAIPVGVAADIPSLYADSQPALAEPAAPGASADTDFEARVAAAMAGYDETPTASVEAVPEAASAPVATAAPEPELVAPVTEPEPMAAAPEPPAPEPIVIVEPEPGVERDMMGQETAKFIAQMQKAVESLPLDTTPHVEVMAEPVPPPPPAPVAENVPDHALAAAMAAAVGASVEPQVVAAVTPPEIEATQKIDPGVIADIVHRVVERMKPDLAAEIAKELESRFKH